jgi:(p)ppGpp synthase/HD superfamily hydrolase
MGNWLEEIYGLRKDLSEKDKGLIEKAYFFAEKAHRGQMKGKKPFFDHPAAVGYLLAKWKQDANAISAGLLHDTIEDCGVKLSEIKNKFGEKVAFYVDGMSWARKKVNGKSVKDYEGLYKKFLDYVKQDAVLAIIKAADEMSRSDPKDLDKFVESLKEKGLWEDFQKMINERFRGFWIPFFKEIGLNKVIEKIEIRGRVVKKDKIKVILHNYISKEELAGIKGKISGMKGISELR